MDSMLLAYHFMSMEQLIADSPSTFMRRFPALLIGIFSILALLLAAIGTYGVISYSVSQRTQEIGIRLALGAERSHIFRLVIGQGIRLAFIGLAIGILSALALTRLLATFLFEISPTDLGTFAIVSFALALSAIFACYIPARRATRVDPMVALRYE
jgi:putative ABC transport system permease protein